ncbi:IPT/TIG domain-containing protein [Vallicoccus soli]|nr:IPT/TIG domain-containing protein [Vallicoccus soli]
MLSPRRAGRAALSTAVAVSALAGGLALGTGSATAAAPTITSVAPHLVAALTANQIITVTGTGFSEDVIADVSVTGCTTDPVYIVSSPTSLLLKTAADCAAGTNAVVTLKDDQGATLVASTPNSATATVAAAHKLNFVAAPTISAKATTHPVIQANTSAHAQSEQVITAPVGGGTTVKVTAGSTPFVNTTATPLAATLGGVPLTGIVMASGGASFTGKVGPHAAGAVALSVTSGGVTKTFSVADTDFSYAGNTITVTPAFGPSNGGNDIKIAGTGFTAGSTVTVCGTAATVKAGTTATAMTVTVPKSATTAVDGPCTVKVTTGTVSSVVTPGSTYTYVAQG